MTSVQTDAEYAPLSLALNKAMPRSDNLYELPENLPVPGDDGACDHLPDMRLPSA